VKLYEVGLLIFTRRLLEEISACHTIWKEVQFDSCIMGVAFTIPWNRKSQNGL